MTIPSYQLIEKVSKEDIVSEEEDFLLSVVPTKTNSDTTIIKTNAVFTRKRYKSQKFYKVDKELTKLMEKTSFSRERPKVSSLKDKKNDE